MKTASFLETRRVQSGLKVLLKARGYSYQHLARELEVSLPTVKRMLTAEDISLGRVSKICALLGVQFHEFLEITRSSDGEIHYFTPEQETFFAENPSYLRYLQALHNARDTPTSLERTCKLSKRSTRKYLGKLTEMGLIRVHPNGQVKVLIQGLVGWDDRGPLGKVLSHKMIREMCEKALSSTSEDRHLELSGRMLTPQEYETMRNEIRELTAKYRRISKLNSVASDLSRLRRYEVMVVADRTLLNRYSEICELQ